MARGTAPGEVVKVVANAVKAAAGTASPARRQRLGPDERRSQLVELGVALIKVRPFDQVLVDEVIKAAGISKGLLFHYFASKRDYQVAVVSAAAGELVGALQPDESLDVLTQLRQGIDAYISFIERNPASYIAIVRGAGSDDALLAVFETTRDAIVALIAGKLATDPSPLLKLAIRGWIASVEEATFLWLRDEPCSRDALIELLYRSALQLLPLVDASLLSLLTGPAR
ncbi:MAG: TetR/AcrR family transcriptional regulator [Acidimicrobiales bacterium]